MSVLEEEKGVQKLEIKPEMVTFMLSVLGEREPTLVTMSATETFQKLYEDFYEHRHIQPITFQFNSKIVKFEETPRDIGLKTGGTVFGVKALAEFHSMAK